MMKEVLVPMWLGQDVMETFSVNTRIEIQVMDIS